MAKSNAINLMAQFIVHDALIEIRGVEQPVQYRNFTEYVARESAKETGRITDMGRQVNELEVVQNELPQSKNRGSDNPAQHALGELTLNYIGDTLKTDNVFNEQSYSLSKEEMEHIHQQFDLAQANKTPLWQFVYSFDNDYLKASGLLTQDGVLYDKVFKDATIASVTFFKEKMELNHTMTWVGGIHYNTDNIHIHVAVVETESSREKITKGKYRGQYRASLPKGTLKQMRSLHARTLFKRSPHLIRIPEIMRQNLNQSLKEINLTQQRHVRKRLMELVEQLPEDRRLWRYNMNVMQPYHREINELTRIMVLEKHPELFEELYRRLSEQQAIYTDMYGKTSSNYRDNKLQELDAMLGNTLLKKLKEAYPKGWDKEAVKYPAISHEVYRHARKLLLDNKQKYLNKLEHERLEQERLAEQSREINY